LKSAFQKISRVTSIAGATKWYLSNDCLLAAKRTMYVVEYRRFFLRDLEWIMVWPSRGWLSRIIVPALLSIALGASLWLWANSTAGAIFIGIGLGWVLLEMLLGPTAKSRVRVTGISVDLRLVNRMRHAGKVLAEIDAAVRAARDVTVESATPIPPAAITMPTSSKTGTFEPTNSETASAVSSLVDASQTNAF
jgi:hypothetical protein